MKGLILNRNKYIKERKASKSYHWLWGLPVVIIVTVAINSVVASSHEHTSIEKELYTIDKTNQFDTDDTTNEIDTSEIREASTTPSIVKNDTPATYLVTKVVDGDTIYVDGIGTRIRLIGVNTPETVDSSKPVECYGPEASNYLRNLILGRYVGLESDSLSGDVDKYGRPLRYVYYNNENINQKIILGGYGKEASYGSSYKYQSEFDASEKYAKQNDLGLWSPSTCNEIE